MPDLTPPSFVRLRFTRPPRPDSLLIAGDVGRFPPADADRYLADGCAVEEPERTGYDLAALDAYRRTPWRGRRMLGGARRWLDVVLAALIVLAILSLPGCGGKPAPDPGTVLTDPANLPAASQRTGALEKDLGIAATKTKSIGEVLADLAAAFKARATVIDQRAAKAPEVAKSVKPETDAIRKGADGVAEQGREVDPKLTAELVRLQGESAALRAQIDKGTTDLTALEKNRDEFKTADAAKGKLLTEKDTEIAKLKDASIKWWKNLMLMIIRFLDRKSTRLNSSH